MGIAENYHRIRKEIPEHVSIVVAGKGRTAQELSQVIEAGATDIGQNYVQDALRMRDELGEKAKRVRWHMIGALQKNKINKALPVFDVIQTIDSLELAKQINKRVVNAGKEVVPVYIEINIGSEATKAGVEPEYDVIENLVRKISLLEHLRLEGLMTMAPYFNDPEESRQYFRKTKHMFERLKALNLPNTDIKVLSMGMSDSYRIAIEEGSNMVRIGTSIFGQRRD